MNRIDTLFEKKQDGVLSVYTTAGHPSLEDTPTILESLQKHGVDMVEIGIPFSDPLADGPVIQQSSQIALRNGMSLKLLFDQLGTIRESVSIPLILMGYLNPVLQMGMERFLEKCSKVGIDGLILPDLPPQLYASEYRQLFQQFGIYNIMLITPQTSEERIRQISTLSAGFLYMVADAATTGAKDSIGEHQVEYFRRIGNMGLSLPALIGFGISNQQTFDTACKYARGAIIGSAFIKALEGDGSLDERVMNFVQSIRK